VFVDDGSSDHSKEILFTFKERLAAAGIRLKYIHQENRGPAAAIQSGLKEVTGEYLTLLDIDDEYLEHSIASKAAYLDEHLDMTIVFSNGYSVYDDGTRVPFASQPISMDNLFDKLVTGEQYNWAGSYMIRANRLFSYYRDHTFYISRHGQHLQLLMPLAHYGKGGYIHQPLMCYYRLAQSHSSTFGSYQERLDVINGYEDIRLHVVRDIVPEKEYGRHEAAIAVLYMRARLALAYKHRQFADAKKEYGALKACGVICRGDRLLYARSQYGWLDSIYKVAQKCIFSIRNKTT
jgi:glycosyltransferase involved in cell wall biosynthesis